MEPVSTLLVVVLVIFGIVALVTVLKTLFDGLRSSIEHFREAVPGATAEDVMALVLLTQYFDTLKDIGTKSGTNTLFLPSNPGAAGDFLTQILAGLRGGAGHTGNATAATPLRG